MPIPDQSQTTPPQANPGKQRKEPATGAKDRSPSADSAMQTIPQTRQEMESRAIGNEDQRAKHLRNDERGANTARERTVRAIQENKRTQAACVAGGNADERRTITILNQNQTALPEVTPRSEAATRTNDRSPATYSAREKNPGTTQETETRAAVPDPGTFPKSQRSRVTSLTAGYPGAPGTRRNPVVLLEKISATNVGMPSEKQKKTTQEYMKENQTSRQEEDIAVVSDTPSFVRELVDLDNELEEGQSAKIKTQPKLPRIDKISKQKKKQHKYKKLQLKGIKHPKTQNIKRGRKRKISSEEEQWQPSEEQYTSTNDSEYSEKSPTRKKKLSKKMTMQTTENNQKQGYEENRLNLSTQKETTDKSKKDNLEPQQSTSTSTFCLDLEKQTTKKDKAKKSQKSEGCAPPKKQKNTEEVEIEIPKHIFTIMAQQLKEKHVDKSHVKTQKQEWKGSAVERKRISVIYCHITEKLKNLMRQNIELPEQERIEVEEKVVRSSDGTYKCNDCNEKSFQKKRELYRHIRIVHNYTPLMHVCGYGECTEAANNTTSLGIHTVHAHFGYLFKDIKIPIK